MKWVKQEDLRQESFPQLLAAVRLPLLSPHYLADRVATEELIRSSHECRLNSSESIIRVKSNVFLAT